MDSNDSSIEVLIERAETYSSTTVELLKFRFIHKLTDVVSSLALKMVIYLSLAMFIFIINFGIALWLGDLLGKNYYGFFIIAFFYAMVFAFVCCYGHRLVKVPVSNRLISELLELKNNGKGEPR